MTYAGEFIRCGHCGHPITGEHKTKKFKNGTERSYIYYRCARYTRPGHPRTRIPEADFDRQILALFDKMKVEDESVREWFQAVLFSKTKDSQSESLARRAELQRQQARDLNNPYDKKRPKIWGTIKTALNRLQKSGFSELADHLEESIDSERAWFVYVPKRNPTPDWKTEKKDDFLRQ